MFDDADWLGQKRLTMTNDCLSVTLCHQLALQWNPCWWSHALLWQSRRVSRTLDPGRFSPLISVWWPCPHWSCLVASAMHSGGFWSSWDAPSPSSGSIAINYDIDVCRRSANWLTPTEWDDAIATDYITTKNRDVQIRACVKAEHIATLSTDFKD